MQTVWKGSISFGLVSIPVRLVSATEERDVAFRQVHAADGGRVRYKRFCELGHEVAYADIAKGYELPDGDIVVIDDDDLRDLPVPSSKAVDVLSFIPFEEVDPVALSRAYYAEPTGDTKPYVLLREALERAGRVAVVKVALRNRERLAVLRPRDGVLVVQTMLWPDEVRRADFRTLTDTAPVRPQELAMAESYVATLSGDFEPEQYVDEYRQALEEVVQAKVDGREVTQPVAVAAAEGTVVDLMEALRRSVEEAKRRRGEGDDGAATEPAAEEPKAALAPRKRAAKTAAAKASGDAGTTRRASAKTGTGTRTGPRTAAAKAAPSAAETTAATPAKRASGTRARKSA